MPVISSTQMSTVMETDRSDTREAVQKAYNQFNSTSHSRKSTANDDGFQLKVPKSIPSKPSLLDTGVSVIASVCEWTALFVYRCLCIAGHAALAVSFLAFVAVCCLGNFHDNYFVTILERARRLDSDLQDEVTYYNRKCGVSDVSTSKHHHIHLGVDPDKHDALDIFVDPSLFEYDDDDDDSIEDEIWDEHGKKIAYQQKQLGRRRRRFAPAYNIWEKPALRPIPKKVAKRAGQQAVRSMMKHGSVMIPQILSDATMEDLREFIVDKNERVLGTPDQYPMSASHHRISYGIESTEHPSVVRALKEIHDHGIFAELIQNLVGDENPALSEITAITAWGGAEMQSWHPDVKPDGNGVMFGRTYSHSYSLFLPLQDTVGEMGPTDLCPGTHMCADEDLWDMCEENKIGLHEIRKAKPRHLYDPSVEGTKEYLEDLYKEGTWRAGDGALLNQQGWHRGTAHTDEDMDDRVVFIVSFLKRPSAADPRQLARGTYFHQKWLNWGSTWQDMADAAESLKRPWNILRCLHLYKASDRSWGYDLFTATTLRIANEQMGGEAGDLEGLIDNVMIPLRYPEWLQGTIDYDSEEAWQMYLRETIQKTHGFLYRANAIGLTGFMVAMVIIAILAHLYNRFSGQKNRERSVIIPVLKASARRLVWTHGSILAFGLYVWHVLIRSSQWAIDIDSGTTLMRPFPPDPIYRDVDPGVQGGNTTLPRRSDVLIGTRYHTNAIGAYRTWLDYHPGNSVFNDFVNTYGGNGNFYHSLLQLNKESHAVSQLPLSLADQLASVALNTIQSRHDGRFLMQDYRSGDWKVLSEAESKNYIHKRLFVGSKDTLLGALNDETELMLNRYRFGVERKTFSMAWNSQLFVADLSESLFSPANKKYLKENLNQEMVRDSSTSSLAFRSILPHSSFRLRKRKKVHENTNISHNNSRIRRYMVGDSLPSLFPGMEIYYSIDNSRDGSSDEIFFATLIGISSKKTYDGRARYHIAFDGSEVPEIETTELGRVKRQSIRTRPPITEGSRVMVGDVAGTILLVLADGSIDVVFDEDGEIDTDIPYTDYELFVE